MFARLSQNWVYGGFLAGWLLLGLSPVICRGWSWALTLVFLQLPIYMLHQFEEHDADRFRRFFNETIGRGREVLTPAAVAVINVPGVWGVNLASILLANFVAVGWGLIGVYLTLVNGVIHVVQALATRRANPGVFTAAALFLPLGGLGFYALRGQATVTQQVVALVLAVGIHAAIIAYARHRAARL